MRSQIQILCLLASFGILFSTATQAQLPTDFYDELWDNNYNRLTGIAFDDEGRGFTWERNGLVYRLSPEGERLPTPLLDIREEVADWSDMGMVGFALHPDFLDNGWFYVFYSLDRHHYEFFGTPQYSPIATVTDEATIARLTRFTADVNSDFTTIVPNSRKVLLGTNYEDGAPLVFKTHATGSLVFGTDGTLFAAVGETAFPDDNDFGSNNNTYYQKAIADGIIREEENVGAFRSQMINSLGGKILRIDAETGAGLPSNPFYDAANPRAPRSRVWAMGFRNPYRFVLVPETGSHFPADGQPGHLLIGDVGGNEWEEITLITEGGQNGGWPFFEGLEIRPAAVNSGIIEQDEINGSCQDGVPFSDLIAEDGASVGLTNQCNTTPAFSHRRPLLAYRNKAEGRLPDSEIPIFDTNGQAARQSLSDPNSPVDSDIFHGIGSLAGVFYEGEQFPEEYHGRYLHIDYLGWMQWMDWDQNGQLTKVEPFLETDRNLVSLAVHPLDGSLWYVDVLNQQLRRIGYGGIPRPVPNIEASAWYGPSPLSVDLSAETSTTVTEYPLTYFWELPDGQTSTEESLSTVVVAPDEAPFVWPIKLTVTDSSGQSATKEAIISVNNTPPQAEIVSFTDGAKYPITETNIIELVGTASDAEFGEQELLSEWQIFLEHDDHEHNGLPKPGLENFAILSPLGCADDFYAYRIEFTVSDPAGLSTTVSKRLFPNCDVWTPEKLPFLAEATENAIWCTWPPIDRMGLKHYLLQRSTDGIQYTTIDTLPAGALNYQYEDRNPWIGTSYYRLRMDWVDHAFHYSSVQGVQFPGTGNFRVFPNPTTDQLTVQIKKARAEEISFQIFDTEGRLLWQEKRTSVFGQALELLLDLQNYPQGLYFLAISNGLEIFEGSFIKMD